MNICSLQMSRTNHHLLKPKMVSIKFDSPETITNLNFPRTYTWLSHRVFIGDSYNSDYMDKVSDNYVIGDWVSVNNSKEIHLQVMLKPTLSKENREKFLTEQIGLILEEIAYAETALLTLHPSLASTKIMIQSQDSSEYEYWHRLGHWAPESLRDISSKPEKKPEKKKKHSHGRVAPQMCAQCKH